MDYEEAGYGESTGSAEVSAMRFLLTIYDDERRWASVDEEEAKAEIDAYWALDNEAGAAASSWTAAASIRPRVRGRVRIRDGEQSVTDGPFAETKEQLGGYYLLDCGSIEEALEWAAKIPRPTPARSRCASSWTTRPPASPTRRWRRRGRPRGERGGRGPPVPA